MAKDYRSQNGATETPQQAPAPQGDGMEFGSNAERIEYVKSCRDPDGEMAEQMNAGLPDTELGILLIEAASTGARKEFQTNDTWKAVACERFQGRQLDRWDWAMSTVWEVDEIMRETGESDEVQAALADMQEGMIDLIASEMNQFAAFADVGDKEDIGDGRLSNRHIEAPFNGSYEKFEVTLGGAAELECREVDEGMLWSERIWAGDFQGFVHLDRKQYPHQMRSDMWSWVAVTTYTNDLSTVGLPKVEVADWDDLQLE